MQTGGQQSLCAVWKPNSCAIVMVVRPSHWGLFAHTTRLGKMMFWPMTCAASCVRRIRIEYQPENELQQILSPLVRAEFSLEKLRTQY